MENGISKINLPITENMENLIVEVHAQVTDLKAGVPLEHGVSLLFILFPASSSTLDYIPSKE